MPGNMHRLESEVSNCSHSIQLLAATYDIFACPQRCFILINLLSIMIRGVFISAT